MCTGTIILSKSTQYDDAGNGIIDHTQSDVNLVNADGAVIDTVSNATNDNLGRQKWVA